MDECVITIENASVKRKYFTMKSSSLEIPRGYIIGIQGDNGAGKTTLLNMILGMYDKMEGNIYIDGLDVVKNQTQIKELVGVVSQDRKFYLSQDANGNEKLYKPFYHNWNSEKYHRMLRNLNIPANRKLGNFSTGEMIKFQLAFSAAYSPQILIMDEPTANLDPVFRDDFLKILQEFVAEYEMTILIATHLDEDLSKVADYIIDVEDGEYSMREYVQKGSDRQWI